MTSQGTPHGRFARAIQARHLQQAIYAAHESKLAARWHARFVGETPGIGAAESAFALAAAGALGGPLSELAAGTLRQLVRTRGGRGWAVQRRQFDAAPPQNR